MLEKRTMMRRIKEFSRRNVLVVGDLILDLYIQGEVERISPEAPVPVVLEKTRRYILGGAGNVAANVAALGGRVTLVGVVGNDEEAKMMRALARGEGIRGKFIVDRKRPTILKTRAVARRHQVLRIDREIVQGISKATERNLVGVVKKLPKHDGVILSDYAKGCLTKSVIDALGRRFGRKNMIAGIKPRSAPLVHHIRAVALNVKEAEALTGVFAENTSRATKVVRRLARELGSAVVLTRGEFGMTVHEAASGTRHIRSRALHVFDVTGAGDTVLGALGLMLASGADLMNAAEVANHAAGVVVGKPGTEVVLPEELLSHIEANGDFR